MFSWFIRNRKGSITIMISALLIAVLSMSSTLIEIAKYRSMERVFKEAEENAAFSVLSQYDRDLYENFGLLAISNTVGEEQLVNYLNKNLNNKRESLTEDVLVDKLYDLGQKEVLRTQIMEFCAYRAPYSLVNNGLNIEATLQSLIKNVEDNLPFLNTISSILGVADTTLKIWDQMGKVSDAGREYKNTQNEYENDLEAFNKAVEQRNAYTAAYEAQKSYEEEHGEPEEGAISEEEYQTQLKALNDEVKNKANVTRSTLEELKEKTRNFDEKASSFLDSFENLGSKLVKVEVSTSKWENAKENASSVENGGSEKIAAAWESEQNKIVDNFNEGYQKTKQVGDTLSKQLRISREIKVDAAIEEMEQQRIRLGKEAEQLETDEKISSIAGSTAFSMAVGMALSVAKTAVQFVKQIAEGLQSIARFINALEMAWQEDDPIYGNNILDPSLLAQLSGHANQGAMWGVHNVFADVDGSLTSSRIQDASKVAGMVGFDVGSLNQGRTDAENYTLQNSLNYFYGEFTKFVAASTALVVSGAGLIISVLTVWSTILNIISFVVCAITFVASLIQLCQVMSRAMRDGSLATYIYQRLYAATYACEMFSNFTTDLGGDTRLNGSSYFNFSNIDIGTDCFDVANAEYIFGGDPFEKANLKSVVLWIVCIRMLSNIPAVLTNQEVMELVNSLMGTGIGAVVGVILFFAVCALEALLDKLLLINGGSVPIIKTEGYMSKEGADELIKKLQDILKIQDIRSRQQVVKDTLKAEDKPKENSVEKWAKGLLEWDYKDYLFYMMLITKPSDVILSRCADLIELQMRKLKGTDGFALKEMATCIRVDATGAYEPLMPIPVIPGLNSKKIEMRVLQYSGY